ncbi:ATP-binding protein [Robbsia sp. KACC 23696]|uniref:ATP-binding protein n=1 Tax=Robbsia sp. KACC 23696 TaxID=3149231 RepID=UPI00325AF913
MTSLDEHEALRRRMQTLQRELSDFKLLFAALDAGFCVIEMKFAADGTPVDYRFVEINAAFIRQTGLVDARGKWIRDLVPAHEQHWFDIYGEVARTAKPVRFENAAEALGRWYEVQAFPIGLPELHHVAILFTDISERRAAELSLRTLAARLEEEVAARTTDRNQLWQLSTDIMLRCRFTGEIVAVNPAWTTTLGWSEAEMLGSNLFDLIHPDDLAHTREGAESSAGGVSLRRFENRYRTKGGDYRWIDWSTQPSKDMINAVGRDVTEEKEKAETLKRMEAQLRQSQKMEAVGQLTGGLAHDFNNLLAGINGNLELLSVRLTQGRLSDMDRYVSAAQGSVKRAAALTHRLLAFSRRQTLDPSVTDVAALVADLEELIGRTIGPDRVLSIQAPAALWTTMIDRNQLENALLNLSINARDAMPDGGRIDIGLANEAIDAQTAAEFDVSAGDYVTITVTDTGSGMTPEIAARAFDPFFTTKPIGQGTGLGLSMIYGFARQSGGHVRIESAVGRGTMVRIYLPRFTRDVPPAAEPVKDAMAPTQAGGAVLVVDDEATLRMLITEVLEDSGYTVIEASDGPSGLTILQSDIKIDMLVTDVGLPGGMNGRQLADAARSLRADLQVLFITGYAEGTATGKNALEPGMHVLTKPFLIEALVAKVGELIAEGRRA